ncbi:MAG: T9SS type A sorting domain-containing protein, partial [Saprospiraceae bacterium]|nr:T9SS type A sorting domain-containing protein [Saprospiraceae bacterium]
GNGVLESNDAWDEESRRREASELLATFIDLNHPNDQVIMLGDLNDVLTDPAQSNVFSVFLDDPDRYQFVDMAIAEGSSAFWSYPNWPSHLDHILVTNGLFEAVNAPGSTVQTIRIDEVLPGGFDAYDEQISDHRPVAMRLVLDAGTTPASDPADQIRALTIFPNPFSTRCTLTFHPATGQRELLIVDLNGNTVAHIAVSNGQSAVTFDGAHWPAGVYFACLVDHDTIHRSRPVIKAR